MNARELHDNLEPSPASMISPSEGGSWVIQPGEDQATILRALDLLARVEESTDELVRELRGIALFLAYRDAFESERTVDKAAAALVALRAELAEWKASGEKMAQRFNEVVAKRDRLKAHAEAMANGVEGKVYYADAPDVCEAVDAYRRDFPKDAP